MLQLERVYGASYAVSLVVENPPLGGGFSTINWAYPLL